MSGPNPYTTPAPAGSAAPTSSGGGSSSMVHQIRVVAILMMVHGGMSIAAGLVYVGIAIAVPWIFDAMPAEDGPPQGAAPPTPVLIGVYAGMGTPAIIAGVLQVFAGWRNYDLRSRTLGIIAAIAGVAASTTCYCAPTGIAMAVYGLIVLLNTTVAQAFAWRAEGLEATEVFARFFQPYAAWQSPGGAAEAPQRPPAPNPDEPPRPA